MFKKLKMKASQPLTHGWLWKIGAINIIAAGIIYGGLYAYGCYLEKKENKVAETEMNYDKSKDED